ncbi:MAG: D-hexose-6-phosphate mutarotase [Anaerolineae bacterium]|nr:D-hexose-6-phosphate mutarotase [Anaerolineae bacterium]
MTDLATLNTQFGIDNHLVFTSGTGGLTVATINNRHAEAVVALHGGHVLSFQPHGHQPVLWLSEYSHYTLGKAIRGGIPVCWPWFANHPSDPGKPSHGFARTTLWTVIGSDTWADGSTQLRLELDDSAATQALWPYVFQLELVVTVGSALQVDLNVHNPGNEPFVCTDALHTYFSVSDITNVSVLGLEDVSYLDKVDNGALKTQQGPITFTTETDRIYLATTADCLIVDSAWQRRIRVAKQGSRTTVVWNPWIEKAQRMADFGDEEYHTMVCVETTNAADDVITVSPGGSHRLQTLINVETD